MSGENCGTNCFIPPPLYPGPGNLDSAWCVSNCGPCVPMKRRYADCDYITITPAVSKTFVRLLASQQDGRQIDPARVEIYVEIRLRGCNNLIACYNAFQRTAEGFVGFYWDATFTGQCPGLYVGDVFVDCKYCFSILFRIPKCEIVAQDCYNEFTLEDCGLGECSMVDAVGAGVVGGLACETAPPATECGVAPPYFESMDPVEPPPDANNCNLSCTPAFHITGDDIVGSI